MSKLICLDAGHGGMDSGACGNGLKEKDITLKMIKKIGVLLTKNGLEVIYTRTTDNYVKLNERCRIANSKNCDCFVSVHTNSAVNSDANGIETLCYTQNNLAFYVQQNLIKELNLTDRGVKERKDLAVLNGTEMQAILIELGFISNAENASLMTREDFLDKSAECIARGVCKYLGVDYREENKEIKAKLIQRQYKYKNNIKSFEVLNYNDKNYVAVRDLTALIGKEACYYSQTKLTEILN